MTVEQAVKKLRGAGYSVTPATNDAKLEAARDAKNKSKYRSKYLRPAPSKESVRQNFNKPSWNVDGTVFSERGLIKFAKNMRKIGNNNLKNFSKRTRAAERDAIKTESFDKIPQRGPLKVEDPWGWD